MSKIPVSSLALSSSHSFYLSQQSSTQLANSIQKSILALLLLQNQLTSLASVTLKNQRTFDLLTAEKGSIYLFFNKEKFCYVNQPGKQEY